MRDTIIDKGLIMKNLELLIKDIISQKNIFSRLKERAERNTKRLFKSS